MRCIVGKEKLGKVNILALAALDQVSFQAADAGKDPAGSERILVPRCRQDILVAEVGRNHRAGFRNGIAVTGFRRGRFFRFLRGLPGFFAGDHFQHDRVFNATEADIRFGFLHGFNDRGVGDFGGHSGNRGGDLFRFFCGKRFCIRFLRFVFDFGRNDSKRIGLIFRFAVRKRFRGRFLNTARNDSRSCRFFFLLLRIRL